MRHSVRNYIQELFNLEDGIAFELRTDLLNSPDGTKFVAIFLTFLHKDYLTYHYFIDIDKLEVWDYSIKTIQIYNNFSQLSDEATHFQQMTVLDHIGFEHDEVQPMMDVINRIKSKHETKST